MANLKRMGQQNEVELKTTLRAEILLKVHRYVITFRVVDLGLNQAAKKPGFHPIFRSTHIPSVTLFPKT